MKLEELTPNAVVRGVVPDALVTVVQVSWHGTDALQLLYRQSTGAIGETLLFRDAGEGCRF